MKFSIPSRARAILIFVIVSALISIHYIKDGITAGGDPGFYGIYNLTTFLEKGIYLWNEDLMGRPQLLIIPVIPWLGFLSLIRTILGLIVAIYIHWFLTFLISFISIYLFIKYLLTKEGFNEKYVEISAIVASFAHVLAPVAVAWRIGGNRIGTIAQNMLALMLLATLIITTRENLRDSIKYLLIFTPIFVFFGGSISNPVVISDFILMALIMLFLYRRDVNFKNTAISFVLAILLFLWLFLAIYYAIPSFTSYRATTLEVKGGFKSWFMEYKEEYEGVNAILLYPISFWIGLQRYNGYFLSPPIYITWSVFMAIIVLSSLYYLKKERHKPLAYGVIVYTIFVGLMFSPHLLWRVYLWIMREIPPLLAFRMTFDKFHYGAQLGFTIMLAYVLVKILPNLKKPTSEDYHLAFKKAVSYLIVFLIALAIFLGAFPALNGIAMKSPTKEGDPYFKAEISKFEDLQTVIKELYLENLSARFLYVPSTSSSWIQTIWYNSTDYAYYLPGMVIASSWGYYQYPSKLFSLLSSEDFIFNETKQENLLELFKLANIKYIIVRGDVDLKRLHFREINIGTLHQIPNVLFFIEKYGFEKVYEVGNGEFIPAITIPFDNSSAIFNIGKNIVLENFTISITFRRNVNSWYQVNVLGKEDFAKGIIAEIGNLLIADFGNAQYGIVFYNESRISPLTAKGPYDTGWHEMRIIKNASKIEIFFDDELSLSEDIEEFNLNFSKVILGLAENFQAAKSISLDFSFNGYIADFRIKSNNKLIFDLWDYYDKASLNNAEKVITDPLKPKKLWVIFRSPYHSSIVYGIDENNSLIGLEFKNKSPVMISIFPKNATYSKIIVASSYDPRWVMEIYTEDKKSESVNPTSSYLGLLEFKLDINKDNIGYVIVRYTPHFIILRMILFSAVFYLCLIVFVTLYKRK